MVFLKEDGSLDIERLNALPIEEHMKMVRELTDEQWHFYVSAFSVNEEHQPAKAIIVDYSMEDEIKRGTGVVADEFLKKLRDKYGLKSRTPD